jgi:hypothetical protein
LTLNEIKKALYKESPKAHFQHATKDGLLYHTYLMGSPQINVWGESDKRELNLIQFRVPLNEVGDGDAKCGATMEAKLLIRYII